MMRQSGWRRWLHRLGRGVPALCEACGRWPDGPLCTPCRQDLAPVIPRCPRCALPLPAELHSCSRCIDDAPWQQVLARVDYAPPWDAWIAAFKFRGQRGLAAPLARLWLDDPAVDALLRTSEVWLPVPSAPSRLAERGYHPVWELMQALAAQHPTPRALPQALRRDETTAQQHRLNHAQRLAQAPHLFRPDARMAAHIAGRHVLVVDDVMTTGVTLRAACATLLAMGAVAVSALVLARTPPPELAVQ